ncbi:hypothetical protein A0H81_13713 [Grifola frondosa]|uniref:Uncharacterized protein n=1 Tax=Grifola frondosa TaxID=5627 RepID=A0A1C7LN19_GRIFR|nr:hypothetical protein A0H81_13713 [Grifola frondosa]
MEEERRRAADSPCRDEDLRTKIVPDCQPSRLFQLHQDCPYCHVLSATTSIFSPSPTTNLQNDLRLPSIKDLNFPYGPPPGQDGSTPNSGQADHQRPSRHESGSWNRSSSSAAPAQTPQHSNTMPPPHDTQRPHQYPTSKPDGAYVNNGAATSQQAGVSMAGHNASGAGTSRGDPSSQMSGKRPRSASVVSASPGRSPNTTYPPYQSQPPPPSPFHQGPPVPVPAPMSRCRRRRFRTPLRLPAMLLTLPRRCPTGTMRCRPAAPSTERSRQLVSATPAPDHWQPPPQSQQSSVPASMDQEKANARQHTIMEIMKHCGVLYTFVSHYAELVASQPQMQPSPPELEEMTYHAATVVRLLEDLRRMNASDDAPAKDGLGMPLNGADDHSRPPKRPWEDLSREENGANPYPDPGGQYGPPDDKPQSTAEQDMEIIRSKRATSAGVMLRGSRRASIGNAAVLRLLANAILVISEKRRSGDVGLMEPAPFATHAVCITRNSCTLRASTASARGSDPGEPSHSQPQMHHQSPGLVPVSYEQQKHPPMQHRPAHMSHPHPGPYQLMPVSSSGPPPGQAHQMMPPPPPPQTPHSETGVNVPPPPWMTSSSSNGRAGYTQDQSYMRTSHAPSHARASPH